MPGETLAADALANAIGPAFRAAPDPKRVAVAMSGGVDSAVALLRAGPHAIGVTLRLWLDPARPRHRARLLLARGRRRRARDVPRARAAARDARPARGVPPRRRRAVRPRLRARGDAEPVHPLQRRLPLRASCSPSPGAPARRGSRPATTRARASTAAACCSRAPPTRPRTRATCSPASTRACSTASGSRSASRRRTRRAPRRRRRPRRRRARARARRRASSRAATTATSSTRHGLAPREGAIVDEDGRELGRHDGYWRFTPGQRRGLGVAAAEPLYALRTVAASNTVVVGPRESLATHDVTVRGRLHVDAERVEAKLRHRSPPIRARVDADGARLPPRARRARLRRRTRPGRGALRGRRRRRRRADHRRRSLRSRR